MKKPNPLKFFNDTAADRGKALKKAQDGVQLDIANFKTPQEWDAVNLKAGNVRESVVDPEKDAMKRQAGRYETYRPASTPIADDPFSAGKKARVASAAVRPSVIKSNTTSTPQSSSVSGKITTVPNATNRRAFGVLGASKKGGQTKSKKK